VVFTLEKLDNKIEWLRKVSRKRYLLPALSAGLIAMTQPDKPRSPTQKYRLKIK